MSLKRRTAEGGAFGAGRAGAGVGRSGSSSASAAARGAAPFGINSSASLGNGSPGASSVHRLRITDQSSCLRIFVLAIASRIACVNSRLCPIVHSTSKRVIHRSARSGANESDSLMSVRMPDAGAWSAMGSRKV
jgi:hypothetical protein